MLRFVIKMLVAGMALAGGYALAQIVPALPFQLQNNTVADATQVMANFNQLLNNVNSNAAKNGANSDITSLLGLTTPLSPTVGGTSVWLGGTSTGAANAQVVTPVVPATFALTTSYKVRFKAGFTNTGPVTLNVGGTGALAVHRQTNAGVVAAVGAEILNGAMVEVIYDGTQWQLISTPYTLVGEIRDYIGAVPPIGYLLADGGCVSQTTYATLFSIASTNWGSCGAGLFALPDHRSRVSMHPDAGINRVTVGGSGCASTLALGCGAQNQTIAQAQLPNVAFTLSISDTRTWATSNAIQSAGATTGFAAGANLTTTSAQPVAVTGGSIGGTAASGGSGTALTTLQPTLVVTKMIKY